MIILNGKKGSAGIAAGPMYLWNNQIIPERKEISDIGYEIKRLKEASDSVKERLVAIIANAEKKTGEILEAQRMMLEDETFFGRICEKIAEEKVCVEFAAYRVGEESAAELAVLEDAYLRARAEDVKDISRKLVNELMGNSSVIDLSEPVIILANEITPEQIYALDKEKVLGIVTRNGNATSHTAILAGNYGIPYLYGVEFAKEDIEPNVTAILDSNAERFIISPGKELLKLFKKKLDMEKEAALLAKSYEGRVKIYANIGGPEDVEAVLANDAEGIGLFRTEFLYMKRDTLPTEDEQFEAYKNVLEAMSGKEVIIRTMDIGADKKTQCLDLGKEDNPALGHRALRICLDDTELFRTQLRALLRAAVYGQLLVMVPMVASVWEVDAVKEEISLAAEELKARGADYRMMPFGIMIETPAAALLSRDLAKKVDFFSIGTNDLTQYTIALDRQGTNLERFYKKDHEAVMSLIKMTIENAHAEGIPVGICGEMAGDPDIIPYLVELGVDELSMAPVKISKAKVFAAKALDEIKKNEVNEELGSPADGILISMEDIPDEMFSKGIMGKCVAVVPDNGDIYSPCNGTVTMVAETKHAVGIMSDNGNEILVHVGIDTVTLKGEGFECLVTEGQKVSKNDIIIKADLDVIKNAGLSTVTVLAVTKENN